MKTGNVEPGRNGGFQGLVKSPMNKGRGYGIPGVGLAGDWPGGWTQTFAQLDTEAGLHGFDEHYFTQQVAGLSQIAGEMMRVRRNVIDLGWGKLKSALVTLHDDDFAKPAGAAATRAALLKRYVAAFRDVEAGHQPEARAKLKALAEDVTASLTDKARSTALPLVEKQRALIG